MHILSHNKVMALVVFLLCSGSQILVYMLSATVALPLSSETDKHALLALKEKLTNGAPDSLPSWNESLHFCQWQGVTCSPRHMRVSALQLEKENWGGTLGPSLGNLTFLRKLNLTNINLQGEIPREVGRLKRLQILDLRMNHIRGEVPMELTNCSSLQEIILWINNLTGKVPLWFGSMPQLTRLGLASNNLVGSIPSSLGNLSSLQRLTLARNHLEGSITPALEYGAGGPISPQGDMYSYGILLLEMLTGKKPTDSIFGEGLNLHNFCNMAPPERITEIVDPPLLIPLAGVMQQQNMKGNIGECLVSFARIGVACSAEFPVERMSIKDVITELHAIKHKLPP